MKESIVKDKSKKAVFVINFYEGERWNTMIRLWVRKIIYRQGGVFTLLTQFNR